MEKNLVQERRFMTSGIKKALFLYPERYISLQFFKTQSKLNIEKENFPPSLGFLPFSIPWTYLVHKCPSL